MIRKKALPQTYCLLKIFGREKMRVFKKLSQKKYLLSFLIFEWTKTVE